MPNPKKGESQKDFVSRCIPIVLEDGTAEDQDQAVGVAPPGLVEDPGDHRTTAEGVQDLGQGALHPRALARGEDHDLDVISHLRGLSILDRGNSPSDEDDAVDPCEGPTAGC